LRRFSAVGKGIYMRFASIAASLLLAVGISGASLSVSLAAPDSPADTTPTQAPLKREVVRPLKPTWEQCFDMSITRGFNHDTEEWQQSIQDCLAGKIPL
jgi:hypothetical protein